MANNDDVLSPLLNTIKSGWLGTASSQIFLMQLGFLCYESGFVKPMWTNSIIMKNIEDTFVGIMTYILFTYSLSSSKKSLGGLISIPENIFLINVDESLYLNVAIGACFATTACTIISGGVLERLKNKAYIMWCFLICLINYSFISHWVWHPNGILYKYGFKDCAGSIVVHALGGIGSLIPMYMLGPRRDSINSDGNLKDIKKSSQPIIYGIGAFLLWYGWFSFNLTSPIISNIDMNNYLGSIVLITMSGPVCCCLAGLLIMVFYFKKINLDDLISCAITGLVSITGCCYTISIWSSCIIAILSSIIYFVFKQIVRQKWKIDDPLNIISVHLIPGIYSCIMEGIFANGYTSDKGLIYGGYIHFFVQIIGVISTTIFNLISMYFMYKYILKGLLFRKTDIKVSILNTYLGTALYEMDPESALNEILCCRTSLARQLLFHFFQYCRVQMIQDHLEYMVALNVLFDYHQSQKPSIINLGHQITKIIDLYVKDNSPKRVDIDDFRRNALLRKSNIIKNRTKELNNGTSIKIKDTHEFDPEYIFDSSFKQISEQILESLQIFMSVFDRRKHIQKINVKIPFIVDSEWNIMWDIELIELKKRPQTLKKVYKNDSSPHLNQKNDQICHEDYEKHFQLSKFTIVNAKNLYPMKEEFEVMVQNTESGRIKLTKNNNKISTINGESQI